MSILPRLLDLVIFAWPTLPPTAFRGSQEEIDKFTFKLAKSKIEELNTISTTSALLAGIGATVYSWPLFQNSPWPAQSLFGASFICSLISVRKALQQSYILRRLELHNDGDKTEAGDRIRSQLARKTMEEGDCIWIPDTKFQMIWNSSILFLNLGILSLVAGYAWMILASAIEKGKDSDKNEVMIAGALAMVSVLSLAHYFTSGVVIYARYVG